MGCVNQNHKQYIINKDTMKCKKISSCVVIKSTLQQLRTNLLENGRDLLELLEAKYPGADAVLAAVEKIKFLLQDHPVDISDQWVTARVVVGYKKKIISNLPVRKVYFRSFASTVLNMLYN